jgi:sortase A
MALHTYVKEQKSVPKKIAKSLSYFSLIIGALLLFWAYYPVIYSEIYGRLYFQQGVYSPIPNTQVASSLEAGQAVNGVYDVFSSNLKDFVQANVWFPTADEVNAAERITVKEYTLSIPKLNIINAKVTVGGDDLSKSLVHYLPRSLPGEFGNSAIFGHSTIPQLYNVKDYKTIFTYLPSLEKGDKINVTVEGKKYEYEVYDMFIVTPDQVSVLDQRFDASYLTLITCYPLGTYAKRLVVKTKLVKMSNN